MSIAVITTCTKRKENTPVKIKARDLYKGRSATFAAQAADQLKADLFFISCGLGLVHADDLVMPYDTTLTDINTSPAQHWGHVTRTRLHQLKHDQIIICASAQYIDLIMDDLMQIIDRATIYTSATAARKIPNNITTVTMTATQLTDMGFSGVFSDHAQRTLLATLYKRSRLRDRPAQEIVDQTNDLASQFYANSTHITDNKICFYKSENPMKKQMWNLACVAQWELNRIDAWSALIESGADLPF